MVVREDDKDIITIDLSEVYGKVITFSAKDAERMQPEDPALILVMTHRDEAEFKTYVDKVVMDVMPRIAHLLDRGSIANEYPVLQIELDKDTIKSSGLHIIDEALQGALTYGVLMEYQAGAPGYEMAVQANSERYKHFLGALAASSQYRKQSPDRTKIRHRLF